jgi:hypothetical protein
MVELTSESNSIGGESQKKKRPRILINFGKKSLIKISNGIGLFLMV